MGRSWLCHPVDVRRGVRVCSCVCATCECAFAPCESAWASAYRNACLRVPTLSLRGCPCVCVLGGLCHCVSASAGAGDSGCLRECAAGQGAGVGEVGKGSRERGAAPPPPRAPTAGGGGASSPTRGGSMGSQWEAMAGEDGPLAGGAERRPLHACSSESQGVGAAHQSRGIGPAQLRDRHRLVAALGTQATEQEGPPRPQQGLPRGRGTHGH